jgi:hypothetical protein
MVYGLLRCHIASTTSPLCSAGVPRGHGELASQLHLGCTACQKRELVSQTLVRSAATLGNPGALLVFAGLLKVLRYQEAQAHCMQYFSQKIPMPQSVFCTRHTGSSSMLSAFPERNVLYCSTTRPEVAAALVSFSLFLHVWRLTISERMYVLLLNLSARIAMCCCILWQRAVDVVCSGKPELAPI